MSDGSSFICLSIQSGGSIIGVLTSIGFLHNLVCTVVLNKLFLYFFINTLFYGTVTYFFIRHKLSRENLYFLTSQIYFKSFLVLIYIAGNIWNFVFWYCMPKYLEEACDYQKECIAKYQEYGFRVWVFSTIVTSYFAFVLREYKYRLYATLDKIEE